MAGGRPPKYESEAEIEKAIADYFDQIKGKKNPDYDPEDEDSNEWLHEPENPSITGLALFLGFESRQSLYDYEKTAKFSYTVKRARLRIENNYEQALHGKYAVGPIFALKNLGWTDRQEIKHEGFPDPNITVNIVNPKE